MSTSFLVESLLTTDGVKDARCSSSSSSIISKHSQYTSDAVPDFTVNHLSTPRNHKLNDSLTHKHQLLNAAASSQMTQQFCRPLQCHRLAPYDSRWTALLSQYVHYRPPQVTAAVDAYVQLQTLAAVVFASSPCTGSARQTTREGCSAVTHQRRRRINNVPPSLKLAATGLVPHYRQQPANFYRNQHSIIHHQQQQQQQQSRAELHQSCVTSISAPTLSEPSDNEFTRHRVTAGQTGQ